MAWMVRAPGLDVLKRLAPAVALGAAAHACSSPAGRAGVTQGVAQFGGAGPGGSAEVMAPTEPGSAPSGSSVLPPPDEAPAVPFEPLPPVAAASKVKDLLTGLPLTDSEFLSVQADPSSLPGLIDAWMLLPSYKTKMLELFTQVFQQDGADVADLGDQFASNVQAWPTRDRFLASLRTSFARTAWELVVERGEPFATTVTTRRFMLNLPMMVALSYLDAAPIDDAKKQPVAGSWLMADKAQAVGRFLTVAANGGTAIPLSETLDPTSPNYLVWTYVPNPADRQCAAVEKKGVAILPAAFQLMMGRGPNTDCPQIVPMFSEEDWSTYRLVTVRPPEGTEGRTAFWDAVALRSASELVLDTARVGFMTTPGFLGRWATNDSNAFRVTANQSLIVALGRSFEPVGTTIPLDDTNLEGEHAEKGTVCYACHVTLDPMRDFFRQSYSVYYSKRLPTDTFLGTVPAQTTFSAFNSQPVVGNGVVDLAAAILEHPAFASAWAQKLCEYANSGDCAQGDPELERIGELFKASGYQWKVLLRETLSSPVVTFSARTATSDTYGVAVGLARRELLCQRLTERLAIPDACNLSGGNPLGAAVKALPKLALGLPNAGYARGEPRAILPREPNMFFTQATEKICTGLANGLIGTGNARYAPEAKEQAFAEFTGVLMGIPAADSRHAALVGILGKHYDAALAQGAKNTDALRSTFILACSSATGVSSGL
jgi:hypothetical protein